MLRQLRALSDQLTQASQRLEDLTARQLALEQELLIAQQHRLRHEMQFAEVHAMIDRIQRRLEIANG
jgi:hypothetical protein